MRSFGLFQQFIDILKRFSWSILLAIVLIFTSVLFTPGVLNSPTYATASTQPVELDLLVKYLSISRPQDLVNQELKNGVNTDITIKNQPAGQMQIKSVQLIPITTAVTQPDGSVKELEDPTARFLTNMLVTLSSSAEVKDDGSFVGDSKLKIGMPATMEGFNYYFRGNIIDVRLDK